MKNLVPYLTFAGNCREAMNFYKDCLKGELNMQTFAEGHMGDDPRTKDNILHAELKAGDLVLMASDGMLDFTAQPGNTVSLTIDLTDVTEEDRIFNALARGGQVTMPLQDTFWGARYGQVTDRYGIQWMLNCTKS